MKHVLEEQLARLKRVFTKQNATEALILDLESILDEVDDQLGLNQNVFGVLNAEKTAEYVVAKEGARAYSLALRSRTQRLKQALEDAENNQGEMNE